MMMSFVNQTENTVVSYRHTRLWNVIDSQWLPSKTVLKTSILCEFSSSFSDFNLSVSFESLCYTFICRSWSFFQVSLTCAHDTFKPSEAFTPRVLFFTQVVLQPLHRESIYGAVFFVFVIIRTNAYCHFLVWFRHQNKFVYPGWKSSASNPSSTFFRPSLSFSLRHLVVFGHICIPQDLKGMIAILCRKSWTSAYVLYLLLIQRLSRATQTFLQVYPTNYCLISCSYHEADMNLWYHVAPFQSSLGNFAFRTYCKF